MRNLSLGSDQTTGTWDSYGFTFLSKVELVNNYYAIWVSPSDAKVLKIVVDGLVVNASKGRAIKVDDQYVTAPKKVNLTVKNAGGAHITLENLDISNVKADSVNEVWVDNNAPLTLDLVVVVGGNKILEP